MKLGDRIEFDFSQDAINNINKLLKVLRYRLCTAYIKTKDQYGNELYLDADIYSVDELVSYLELSLCRLNLFLSTPVTFDNFETVFKYSSLLVQGAVILALASKALIERGREFGIINSEISCTLPDVSTLLYDQYRSELVDYTEQLDKLVKE